MQEIFFNAFADEMTKLAAGACATPGEKIRSKGRGRGLARGKGRGPMGVPGGSEGGRGRGRGPDGVEKEAGGGLARGQELHKHIQAAGGNVKAGVKSYNEAKKKGQEKKAMSISEKIEAARRDPSTKKNPKDTGPPGSGTQDPRFKERKFGKSAMLDIIKRAMKARLPIRKQKVIDPSKLPLRRGSSRMKTGKEPTPSPMRQAVTQFEAQRFFRQPATAPA